MHSLVYRQRLSSRQRFCIAAEARVYSQVPISRVTGQLDLATTAIDAHVYAVVADSLNDVIASSVVPKISNSAVRRVIRSISFA